MDVSGTIKLSGLGNKACAGTHLVCESLKSQAGIDSLHVPYRGGADALNDFLAGVTQIHSEPHGMPHVKSGKGRLLAIADRERRPDYPDVPLISEVYPDIKIVDWYGLLAPKGYAADDHQKAQ